MPEDGQLLESWGVVVSRWTRGSQVCEWSLVGPLTHTSSLRVLLFIFPQGRGSLSFIPEALIDGFQTPGAMETILTPLTHNHGNARPTGLEPWESLPVGDHRGDQL